MLMLSALKPIPTMLFGCCVGGKSYAWHKYLFVVLIVSGAIMFFYKPGLNSKDESIIGYVLVGISLLMNGFTAGVQEKMRSHARPSPLNLMLFINSWSSAFLVGAVIVSNEFRGFIEFGTKHPDVLINIGAILIVGGFGQIFTCSMITSFGVVPCCIVLTVRKFFNVLFSVIYFGNALSSQQWVATALIFTTLLLDTFLSLKLKKADVKNLVIVERNEGEANKHKNLAISTPCSASTIKTTV